MLFLIIVIVVIIDMMLLQSKVVAAIVCIYRLIKSFKAIENQVKSNIAFNIPVKSRYSLIGLRSSYMDNEKTLKNMHIVKCYHSVKMVFVGFWGKRAKNRFRGGPLPYGYACVVSYLTPNVALSL